MQPENRFSLTRQDFELDTLMRKLVRTQVSPCDILTTSHHYVADRINEVVKCSETTNVEFFGGGVLNTSLMNIITEKLGNYDISHSQWHPQIMEGLAFSWLGYQRIHNKKHSRHMIGTSTDLFLGTIVGPETNSYCVSENKVTKLKKIFL